MRKVRKKPWERGSFPGRPSRGPTLGWGHLGFRTPVPPFARTQCLPNVLFASERALPYTETLGIASGKSFSISSEKLMHSSRLDTCHLHLSGVFSTSRKAPQSFHTTTIAPRLCGQTKVVQGAMYYGDNAVQRTSSGLGCCGQEGQRNKPEARRLAQGRR